MQFSDEDLEAAVREGALAPEAATRLRAFFAARRETPSADDESFRLLTGFNDIFVGIALVLTLVALGWLGWRLSPAASALAVAAPSWALAEFFTRRRRMALPSIILLLAFVGGAASLTAALSPFGADDAKAWPHVALVGGTGALAAFLHWRRFRVPITVAAGVFALGSAAVVAISAISDADHVYLVATLICGLVAFALALAWDMSDPARTTRRADVAFWLHLLAAPAIVHPAFILLGADRIADRGAVGPLVAAVALYAALAIVALVIDRRALMVSSLAYLLYAMNGLFRATGALTVSVALSALIVGAGLLLLSAFWARARRPLLRLAPISWRARLPAAA